MALYIPRSIFHLARLLYVRPETFGPTPRTSLSMIVADIDFDYVNFARYDLKVKYVGRFHPFTGHEGP